MGSTRFFCAVLWFCLIFVPLSSFAQTSSSLLTISKSDPTDTSAGKEARSSIEPVVRNSTRSDAYEPYFRKNKLSLSLAVGYMPRNVPFMFDFLVGDSYTMEPLRYKLVPVVVSMDWQMSRVNGWKFLRGSWDSSFGATSAAIPKGPESRYFGYSMGLRRDFIQRHGRIAAYLDGKVGIGHIDARGPRGVWGAQGQDLVFSLMISSGFKYNINQRYAISAGLGYTHISNMYLSEPRYLNYGINVVGPMVELSVELKKHRPRSL